MFEYVLLHQVFEIETVNCQLSNRVKTIMILVLNLGVKGFKHMTLTIHGREKLGQAIRICWNVLSMF